MALAAGDEKTLRAVLAATSPGSLARGLLQERASIATDGEPGSARPPVDTLLSAGAVLDHVHASVLDALDRGEAPEILNAGLDLEFVQTFLLYRVIFGGEFHDVTYRGMLMRGESPRIRPFVDGRSSIHAATGAAVVEKLNNQLTERAAWLAERDVLIEVRTYDELPSLHGFLVGDHLYLGFTEFDQGKLQGGQFPYLYVRRSGHDETAAHLFRVFRTWFEFQWQRGATVCRS